MNVRCTKLKAKKYALKLRKIRLFFPMPIVVLKPYMPMYEFVEPIGTIFVPIDFHA